VSEVEQHGDEGAQVPQSAPEPGANPPDHEPEQVETAERPEGDLPTPPVDSADEPAGDDVVAAAGPDRGASAETPQAPDLPDAAEVPEESELRQTAEPSPAPELPALPATGDVQVDEALERLHAAQDLPLADQVEAYTGTHRALQDRLADLEG
jgi:hypothetical protein